MVQLSNFKIQDGAYGRPSWIYKNGHNFATGLPIGVMFGDRVGFPTELSFLPIGVFLHALLSRIPLALAGLSCFCGSYSNVQSALSGTSDGKNLKQFVKDFIPSVVRTVDLLRSVRVSGVRYLCDM